jgi:CheY-like chemotaxis protein
MNSQHTTRKPVVLVVDDEALLRLIAVDILETAGFTTIEASDADEALTLMRDHPEIAVLFTDVQMPGTLDGIDLACRVHAERPKVSLLVTSGNIRPRCGDLPECGHFLPKPYCERDVVREVTALIGDAITGTKVA